MKNKFLKNLMIVSTILLCTSCLEIKETLFLRKDGSGNFSFVIDISALKSVLPMIDNATAAFTGSQMGNDASDTKKNSSSDNQLPASFQKIRQKLLSIDSISNIKIIEDTVSNNYGVSFSFKNVAALNKALNEVFKDDSALSDKIVTYFEFKENKLIRIDNLDIKGILGKSSPAGVENKNSTNQSPLTDPNSMLSSTTYTTTYEFEDKITDVKNSNSLFTLDLKKVILTIHPLAINKDGSQKKQTIANVISF